MSTPNDCSRQGHRLSRCSALLACTDENARFINRWEPRPNPLYRGSSPVMLPNLPVLHRAPMQIINKMASNFRSGCARLNYLWWHVHRGCLPPIRKIPLLLLDPMLFYSWPAYLTCPKLTLLQKLARVWVQLFPPRPIYAPLGRASETSSAPESTGCKIASVSLGDGLQANDPSSGTAAERDVEWNDDKQIS